MSNLYSCETLFDYVAKKAQIDALDLEMAAPDFWSDQNQAQSKVAERKSLIAVVKPLEEAEAACGDLDAMVEMVAEDPAFEAEVPPEVERLERLLSDLKLTALLNGPHDASGAIVSIYARDGGTDANDWAEMLLRMYISWAQKQDYTYELIDRQDNEEAGINNATIDA